MFWKATDLCELELSIFANRRLETNRSSEGIPNRRLPDQAKVAKNVLKGTQRSRSLSCFFLQNIKIVARVLFSLSLAR